MKIIKIRYNTICDDDLLYWRVLVDGVEELASDVEIRVPTTTTKDYVFDIKTNSMAFKHHITCYANELLWENSKLLIK